MMEVGILMAEMMVMGVIGIRTRDMDSGSGDVAMRAVVVTRITCYNR